MRYLFSSWDKLREEIANKYIMLFLDYDGTLAPIAKIPGKAVVSEKAKELLRELSKTEWCKIAIISGRSLEDVKGMLGLNSLIYSGNHGLEIGGPKIRFVSPVSAGYKKVLGRINKDLGKKIASIKGAFVEDKGLSLSLHFRLVDKKEIPSVKTAFHEITIIPLVSNKIKIRRGKMVLEVRPPSEWNKGKVVLWLLARQRFTRGESRVLPIYVGDDSTDEDAFRALARSGITVFVGRPRPSYAQYYLKDTDDVKELLERILATDRGLCPN